MPKIVDHDLRRAAIVEATCAVIADQGLEAATMRRIAERAGSTTGLVTHYFESKHAVLIAALRHVHRSAGHRMLSAIQDAAPDQRLRVVIEEALPVDRQRLGEWRVWLAFWAQASTDSELGAEQRSRYAEWTQLLEDVLEQSDCAAHVDSLIALIDGVGTRAALDSDEFPPDRQLAVVDHYLDATRHTVGARVIGQS